jgi:hypothetical protein
MNKINGLFLLISPIILAISISVISVAYFVANFLYSSFVCKPDVVNFMNDIYKRVKYDEEQFKEKDEKRIIKFYNTQTRDRFYKDTKESRGYKINFLNFIMGSGEALLILRTDDISVNYLYWISISTLNDTIICDGNYYLSVYPGYWNSD